MQKKEVLDEIGVTESQQLKLFSAIILLFMIVVIDTMTHVNSAEVSVVFSEGKTITSFDIDNDHSGFNLILNYFKRYLLSY